MIFVILIRSRWGGLSERELALLDSLDVEIACYAV